MAHRQTISNKWKKQLGKVCINCGSNINVEYHHIVPLALGGNNILSNICCLCEKCHHLVHFGTTPKESHRAAQRAGIIKAKLNGTHFGTPPANYEKIMESIATHSTVFENGDLTIKEICELNQIELTTYHKVKNMLYKELDQENWNHSFQRPRRILTVPLYEYQILQARQNNIPIKILQEKRIKQEKR